MGDDDQPLKTPHDALFRAVFERPEAVRGELLAVLPPALREVMDLESIEPLPGRYADEAFRGLESDALFRVKVRGQPTLVYVLLEHQSSVDQLMPWRLLRYMTAIWARLLDEEPTRTSLPPILPLVLTNAPTGWRGPTSFSEVLEGDSTLIEALRPFLPQFKFLLDDLLKVPLTALKARQAPAFARLALWLMKAVRQPRHLLRDLLEWRDEVLEVQGTPPDLLRVFVYLSSVVGVERSQIEALARALLGPETRKANDMITAWDIARAASREDYKRGLEQGLKGGRAKGLAEGHDKGLAEGRDKGLAEGREKGVTEGRVTFLLSLLEARFGLLPDSVRDLVMGGTPEQLEQWALALLTATHLSDVFPKAG
jgi:hypothetical protein